MRFGKETKKKRASYKIKAANISRCVHCKEEVNEYSGIDRQWCVLAKDNAPCLFILIPQTFCPDYRAEL